MSVEPRDGREVEQVEARLLGIEGILSVDLADFPESVGVRCDADAARRLAAGALRDVVREATGVDTDVRLDAVGLGGRAKRARFDGVEVSQPQPGLVRAVARLGWRDERFSGEAEGEASAAGELRACATATVRAVESFAGGDVTFTLTGVKEVHVFDHDLVAVILHSNELPEHRLIGTSIITEDRRRSAALAVLSATNRAVGTFVDPE